MKKQNQEGRSGLLQTVRALQIVTAAAAFLCIAVVFSLCTQPWWDFREPELKPLFTGEAVIPLLIAPVALWVVYLVKTIVRPARGWAERLICLGGGIWFCLPVADRYIHLAEFMLFGPGGIDLGFSAEAVMPAYWMALNAAVGEVLLTGMCLLLGVMKTRIRYTIKDRRAPV